MKKFILFSFALIFSLSSYAQVTKPGELFTEVKVYHDRAVFLKEIHTNKSDSAKNESYQILKNWAIDNYAKDHFYSNVNYDEENKEVKVKSRVELILPADKDGDRKKVMMRYTLNGFIFKDSKCVLEIINISFIHNDFKKIQPHRSRILDAEYVIADEAIDIEDDFAEMRNNTRKSAIFFLNQIANELEVEYGNKKLMDN